MRSLADLASATAVTLHLRFAVDHFAPPASAGMRCLQVDPLAHHRRAGRVEVINHGNLEIATVPLPSLDTLRLLYFGFIYRGKGIEDGVWGAMEPKTNVSSESHRKGAFRSPAHPPGITL